MIHYFIIGYVLYDLYRLNVTHEPSLINNLIKDKEGCTPIEATDYVEKAQEVVDS